jgi:hypothetical protein
MKKALLILAILVCLTPNLGAADRTVTEVRDRSGRLLEKHYTTYTKTGSKTVVRSPTGKKLRVETVRGKKKEIRSPTGRLLRKEIVR